LHEQGRIAVRKVTVARPSSCVSVADRTLPDSAEEGAGFSLFSEPVKGLWISISGFESLGAATHFQQLPQFQPTSDFRLVAPLLRFVRRLFSNRAIHPGNVSTGNQVAVGVYRTTLEAGKPNGGIEPN